LRKIFWQESFKKIFLLRVAETDFGNFPEYILQKGRRGTSFV
jgi:hypothetical protein